MTIKYKAIYADPPWPYKGGGPVGNGGRGNQDGKASQIIQVSVKNHYPTMEINDICKLPIKDFIDTKAHLYLWTTNSFISEAFTVAKAWGFNPKTVLTWAKVHKTDYSRASMKTGYYFRSATEHIIFATKGNLKLKGPCRPTFFLLPRESHSVKPNFFYDLIEEQSDGPYLELFARRLRQGWDSWGNEINNTVNI